MARTPSTAAQQQQEPVCELCGTPGLLCDLPFKHAKTRRVCVMCLAQAIQNLTGWRMVKTVETYIRSTLEGQKLRRFYAEERAKRQAELAQEVLDGSDIATV